MGAGKSSAIKAARAAGLETLDTDELLERELGMPIGEFFTGHGEAEFRRREGEFESALLDRTDGAAVALGGGSVLSESVRTALERHVVVYLEVDAATSWERVEGKGKRPLAHDRERFEQLLGERLPYYESLADAVVPGRREVVKRALPALLGLAELPAGTKLAWARSASGEYPALVGRGLLGSHPFGPIVRHGGLTELAGRTFTVTDTQVGPLYGDAVEPAEARIELPPGETAKTLAEAERVMRELAASGMNRSDHLVAVGGGVVGDLAGFCAATYQRGVPVVQVPTTLVAQVDSAYGGKTGVDLPEGKNYIGAYHQPAAVLADPETLTTLPREELAAGFVEVVKTALIAGGSLWERVRAIERLDPAELDDVIFACARTKLAVVAADERDAGRRQVLNLGHTVGHGIEAATAYARYRHGEAVGLGLLAALRLSGADGLRAEVLDLLARQELPTTLDDGVDTDAVIGAIGRDKKRTGEGVPFVLAERPGGAVVGQHVDPSRVREAVEELSRG
jgi:shikimate kinase/3-dehydroquinate synthase